MRRGAACGRAHTVADVAAAVAAVRRSGVRSWGLDLISGLPSLTRDVWAATLAAAMAAAPQHVSVYDLQVEPGTAFGRWYRPNERPLPSDEESADMYRLASATLRAAGFEHYEVSNYAAPGHRCAHNLCYWRNGAWYAFGASHARWAVRARRRACCALTSRARAPGVAAASHVDGHRFTRPRRLRDYLAWVSAGGEASDAAARAAPGAATEAREELLLDTLMLVRARAAAYRHAVALTACLMRAGAALG